MNKNKDNDFSQKLKDKLRELFQFDSSDLDFGIYRIMNYKRKEIEDFIENDLISAVEKEFGKYRMQNQKELLEKIEEKKKEIRMLEEKLETKILKNGEIEKEFQNKQFAEEYLELKKRIEDIDITESIRAQTFNDLYNFFSRYYEDGDFISKRRYSSKNYKYAIPYNGEEVKLYWANFDQYYIKTGEVFKDYVFNQKGWRFIFKTTLAEVEAGNVKGKRRYFFLSQDNPIYIEGNTCIINFEYRLLIEEDLMEYPVKTKNGGLKKTGITQDEINIILKNKIIDSINLPEPKKFLLEKQEGKINLEKHLYKFTRKITSDFFIHKDLKGFLERELDYFIKIEVLDIDSLDTEKERYFERHITRAKVIKNIGKKIIKFLAQIEDFQKMLWEKKKFVLKTDYIITIDRIPEEFHPEIMNNKVQLKEWEELGFGDINKKEDLMAKKDSFEIKYKKLPVDTKYFTQDFKERLLEKLTEKDSLDDLIDGILIKSENWQALNLLLEKYKEKIQCIYVDPPFNTENPQFLYKDNYKDSSWITLMNNRLNLARNILSNEGNIYLHLDENADYFGRFLMNEKFIYKREIIWNTSPLNIAGFKTKTNNWIYAIGTILFYTKSNRYFFNVPHYEIPNVIKGYFKYDGEDEFGKYRMSRYGQKIYTSEEKGDVISNIWNDILSFNYAVVAADESYKFFTQKPERLLKRIIEVSSKPKYIVLDFFLGIGTTIVVAHKLNRKWIGIEMGNYFNEFYYDKGEKKTGILGRMKEVLFGYGNHEPCGISKEINWQGGGFFKYQYLEQYEDTLHNIEFPQEKKGQGILSLLSEEEKSEYLMKYMLKFETEGSPSLLNLKQFTNPFEYKLKIISGNKAEEIINVDLVETFNYLIGLKINKYRYLTDNGRKYVFVLGEKNYRKVAIVWRSTVDINLEKDKEIISKIINDFKPEEIYINGDSLVKNYKPIESEFKS